MDVTRPRLDAVGAALSGACVVHCVSTPALMSVVPSAASVLGGFHPVLLGAVTAVALTSFVPGFRRHRSVRPLALGIVGVAVLAAALWFEGVAETALSMVGAGVMMTAHWTNRAKSLEARS